MGNCVESGRFVAKSQNGDVDRWHPPDWSEPKPSPVKNQQATEEELQLPTVQELEAIRQEAFTEGYAAGFEQGKKEGFDHGFNEGQQEGLQKGELEGAKQGEEKALEAHQKKLNEIAHQISGVSQQFSKKIKENEQQITDCLFTLVQMLTIQVALKEVSLDQACLKSCIQQVLQLLPDPSEQLQVKVNPKDQFVLKDILKEQQLPWQSTADKEVSRGSVLVSMKSTLIDYALEDRFVTAVEQIIDSAYRTYTIEDLSVLMPQDERAES